eukprot:1159961-Pelagomonas_calceolata.AAC.3
MPVRRTRAGMGELPLALQRVQPRMVSFEEQVAIIRESLATQLEREEQWAESASILAGIDLDSGAQALCRRGAAEKKQWAESASIWAGIDLDSGAQALCVDVELPSEFSRLLEKGWAEETVGRVSQHSGRRRPGLRCTIGESESVAAHLISMLNRSQSETNQWWAAVANILTDTA